MIRVSLAAFVALSSPATAIPRVQSPEQALQELVSDPRLHGARAGVLVVDLDGDRVLCAHDPDRGFMTASNMKLISSAVALLTLGPDYRFRTDLIEYGERRDGVLHGALEIRGAGDPTFGGRHEPSPTAPLDRWANALRTGGLLAAAGDVLGNDDCQPDEVMGEGWAWGYQGAGYAAQVSGLCFAENCVEVVVSGGAMGEPASVRLIPATDYLQVDARVSTAADATRLSVQRLRGHNSLVIRGQVAADEPPSRHVVSVENPTAFAAHELRAALWRAGVEVSGDALDRDDLPAGAAPAGTGRVVASHTSPPLAEILVTLNKVSQNLYAEQLIRAASRHAHGHSSMAAARRHAERVLADLGVDVRGMVIADGSGLTRLNLVHPRQLAGLLAAMWRGPHRDRFLATLPVAGVDGTLAERFSSGPARGRVRAKTGYISRVVALSGYVPRPQPERPPLVFSVLLNNFVCETASAKDAVDRFVNALAQHAGW